MLNVLKINFNRQKLFREISFSLNMDQPKLCDKSLIEYSFHEVGFCLMNMAMFFCYLVKPCPVYTTEHVNTGQVTFFKVPENHGHV